MTKQYACKAPLGIVDPDTGVRFNYMQPTDSEATDWVKLQEREGLLEEVKVPLKPVEKITK